MNDEIFHTYNIIGLIMPNYIQLKIILFGTLLKLSFLTWYTICFHFLVYSSVVNLPLIVIATESRKQKIQFYIIFQT